MVFVVNSGPGRHETSILGRLLICVGMSVLVLLPVYVYRELVAFKFVKCDNGKLKVTFLDMFMFFSGMANKN